MGYIRTVGHFLNRYTATLLWLVCAVRYAVLHQWVAASLFLFASVSSIRLVRQLSQPAQPEGETGQGPKA